MYTIGIDVGGTNIVSGLVSEEGKILMKKGRPASSGGTTAEGIASVMLETAFSLIKEAGIKESDIGLIGIGIPGAVDRDRGIIIRTPNIPMDGFELADYFRKHNDIPVKLENDANCAALGETLVGAGKGKKTSLTVTLGTGVGGGIIIDGKIYSGFNFAAGEIGHIVTHAGGRKCGCGRRGCFEAYASATAIIRDTRAAARKHPESVLMSLCGGDVKKITGRTVFEARDMGDETAKEVIRKYVAELGEGIASLINILQPEVVIVGGGIANQKEKLFEPLREYVFQRTYGANLLRRSEIVGATLGNDAGIIGAALL